LETSLKLLKQDLSKYGEDVLSTLADIADTEPKFFKASFSYVLEFVMAFVFDKSVDDSSLKEMAISILISIVERIPALVKKDNEKLKGIILMLFHEMVSIDTEIDEDWIKPPEGFKDDHENGEVENDEVHFGMQGVDRLISSIGEKVMLPILGSVVQEMVVQQDWRYKNAAIMALS